MAELSAVVRLRPARVALLVSPGDRAAVIKFMRICACMWGGNYNPIIPVFRKPPRAWAAEFPGDLTGLEIARGYIQFFEPDAFVEAQRGLLEKVGLGALRGSISRGRFLSLDEVLSPEPHKDWAALHLGLPVTDCLEDVYRTQQRFVQRDPSAAVTISNPPASGLAEAIFGVYPDTDGSEYFSRTFDNVYRPEAIPCSPASWKKVLFEGVATPLSATSHGINAQRLWTNDAKIFVFDPTQLTDLIDLWNLRSEPNPLVPVPVAWLPELLPELNRIIADEYRQLQGNPNGIMHSAILEFSRGVADEARRKALALLQPGLPQSKDGPGSLSVKQWRDRIWDKPGGGMMNSPKRIVLDVEEQRVTLEVKETDSQPSARFKPLCPSFASRYGTSQLRWVNSLRVANYGRANIATIYPYNTFDRSRPRLGFGSMDVMIGTEGWSFGQRYDRIEELLQLEPQDTAILGFLKRSGMGARLSEPGHIAKQIIDQLGGLWGTHLIADGETLKLINDMAGGVRRRQNGVEEVQEQFDPRSRPIKDWAALVTRRKARSHHMLELDHFTKASMLVLGLETQCTNCLTRNWDAVDRLGYSLTCKRCLKPYPFPQGATNTRLWTYRVAGPFSVQDYAKGAYGAVLAVQTISELESHFRSINFITAVELELDGRRVEADYIAFHQADAFDGQYNPNLILGEAKSFGHGDLIKPKDIARLKDLALRFPGSYLAVSILRNHFTDTEKALLRKLVRWSRKLAEDGGPRNRVLLLTGHELLRQSAPIGHTWKELGGTHAEFSDFHHTNSLRNVGEASIAIHLGMPSFESERHAGWNKRLRKDPNAFPRIPGQWGRILHSMSGPTASDVPEIER
ncbi:hypothetical protein [Rhizobium sp. Root483D2]|uniref:hypothetical protein n=1 Tax=Rhizobium sp. Root483D2 TaxID=1736545 RepID=UPI000714E591|nr:hypothetical protein [Rhizobium sp. Root483D2]KQY25936.1 hypothetical protein ASD32_25995 [Rhizobium sp. Root483D2]